jgi:transketolase
MEVAAPARTDIDTLCINTIRTLSIDAIQKANSGHPGTPMALAPAAYVLWQRFLRFDPANPIWPNRDRFVLSNGHASMLLYSLLYLTGTASVDEDYETHAAPSVSLDDIKSFRQLGSHTPGHPEYHLTSGVETTTGPLGQGVATSVGMAIAGKWLGAHFNRPGFEMFDFDVYAFCGDGDFMEGVSGEAGSVAGHQRLSNLCWVYDNNHITIDGHTELAYSDDVAARFMGYGWNVTRVGDANDLDLLYRAYETFREEEERPTLIILDSHIGWGSPHKQDTAEAHGEPLGEDEVKATKRFYGWPEDEEFLVPEGVIEHFAAGIGEHGDRLRSEWENLRIGFNREYETLDDEIEQMQRRELPEGWDTDIPSFDADEKGMATRKSAHQVLNAIAEQVPWLVSGSADLTGSASSGLEGEDEGFQPGNRAARELHLGIREHESAAISNGLALCKLRPVWSTYLTFSDYARPAIRLSALMELPVVHWFSHDSIGLGEDGPTHQPVEQLASLRAIPGLNVIRPCDANEVATAWRVMLEQKHQPSALILSRQDIPTLDRDRYASAEGLRQGGYVLADCEGEPQVILIATGSEVHLAIDAYEDLSADGVRARVVSLPSWYLFDNQDDEYRNSVLPEAVQARVAVEQASTLGWDRYVGPQGKIVAMHTFGASAPLDEVQRKFGFTPEGVVKAARELLER